MVDRFASYKFLAVALLLAFCWAHVRRDFLMFRPGADAAGQGWADQWIEGIGQLYRLNEARLERGRDLKAPALPASFVRMDLERMKRPAYAQSQQALVQQVASLAQARDAQLAQAGLPSPRRKILESLLAAHKAASPAGESPAMVNDDKPSSHNRRGYSG